MKILRITVLVAAFLVTTAAWAESDCTDPVSEWQSQETLREMMIDNGWEVKRIKVDDGCYEVKGLDQNGNRVEAKFSPASLEILELEVKFSGSGNSSDYLKKRGGQQKSASDLKADSKTAGKKPKADIQ